MASSNSVPKLYKSVIEDVIKNVRESFLNEGVDEQVLQELKTIWESKLLQSRAVESMPTDVAHPARPPYHYPHSRHIGAMPVAPQRTVAQVATSSRVVTHQGGVLQQMPPTRLPHTMINPNQNRIINPNQNRIINPNQNRLLAPATRVVQQTRPRPPVVAVPEAVTPQQAARGQTAIMYPSAHSHVIAQMTPAASAATIALQRMQHVQHVQQVAGVQGYPTAKTIQTAPQLQQVQQRPQQRVVVPQDGSSKQSAVFIQVDGANDSGSDDDDDDDDDDDGANEGKDNLDGDENEEEEDEDPLNSADDDSDDGQADMFDTDNVVVCQYDKITRSRNKWKFHLKDGIMNLRGRDYVFQKATGEAEW